MSINRRHFLGAAAGAGLAAAQAQTSANDKIHYALIGCGGQGFDDMRIALSLGTAEIVAACDVYDGRLKRVREVFGEHVFTTRDHREVLARKDVDAVIIATPDHWHSAISIDAMNAGKDVYCEKPMVQMLADGPGVVETARRTNRIFQVGSQRVSSIVYAKAKDLLHAGAIGE
ncbi:MAG TPA: Gfo/Idh/MocA family oxidoreductase, partial [Candidatus Solibacter sp.]|nr:Gfo/Idh/MocA family oxidoreductase [Candidatus Solibacter sp.]